MLIAFAIFALLTLIVLVILEAYARHMGNPDPTDWVALAIIALVGGGLGAGLFAFTWDLALLVGDLISFAWGLLS